MLSRSADICVALACLVLSLLALFAWVPFDSDTPPIYTFRRQTYIGDAMLPMVAAAGIAAFSAFHLLVSFLRRDASEPQREAPFDALTTVFFVLMGAIIALALVTLHWAGPAAVALFGPSGDEPLGYRQLRSTAPWKYIGFTLGGFILVFGLTTLIEGRVTLQRVVSSMLAVLFLILVFDVPFDTILLPPNGDF